jgi:uncharacterized protein YoxC
MIGELLQALGRLEVTMLVMSKSIDAMGAAISGMSNSLDDVGAKMLHMSDAIKHSNSKIPSRAGMRGQSVFTKSSD